MNAKQQSSTKKTSFNPLETLKETATSSAKQALKSFGQIGGGALDQLMGNYYDKEHKDQFDRPAQEETRSQKPKKQEQRLFNYNEYHEQNIIKNEIKNLHKLIKDEIEMLKKSNHSLLDEVKDIHNIAINEETERPGIYHVRFLEVILSILRAARLKVGESKTWLEAMVSKKKKRGSLFAARTKKMGTQYSLSQELQMTRNVQ